MTASKEATVVALDVILNRLTVEQAAKRITDFAEKRVAEQRAAIDDVLRFFSCGNHGCIVARPRGMGTNGPCRCLRQEGATPQFQREYRQAFLDKLAIARGEVPRG